MNIAYKCNYIKCSVQKFRCIHL